MTVKSSVRKFLVKVKLWRILNLFRLVPAVFSWKARGFVGAAPHRIKMTIIKSYVKKYSIRRFVETGTYLGDTLDYIAKTRIDCASIELSTDLYNAACARFSGVKNIKLLHGDSGQVLPEFLKEISEPTLFWLDGHYSAGITAGIEMHTPISAELDAILNHSIKEHVILIDDARCFDGTNDYPHLDSLLKKIREDGGYEVEVTMDIVRLVPRC